MTAFGWVIISLGTIIIIICLLMLWDSISFEIALRKQFEAHEKETQIENEKLHKKGLYFYFKNKWTKPRCR